MRGLLSNDVLQMGRFLTAILLSAIMVDKSSAVSSVSHPDATCLPRESKDRRQTGLSVRSLLQAVSRPTAVPDLRQEEWSATANAPVKRAAKKVVKSLAPNKVVKMLEQNKVASQKVVVEDLATRILQNMSTRNAPNSSSPSVTRMFPVVWIVVAEKMHGFLQATLACNRALVDKIVVVTSPTDQETINVCQSAGLVCHLTEALHMKGDAFNKGRALREVQQSLHKHPALAGWMALLMDVDICLPAEIWMDMSDYPEAHTLYSVFHRCIYDSPSSVSRGAPTSVEATPGDSLGYFQMYMISPSSPAYADDYPTASESDTDFFQRFTNVQYLPSYVHHFGNIGALTGNWDGADTSSTPWSAIALPQQHCCPSCR